jgi:hypothetical protein
MIKSEEVSTGMKEAFERLAIRSGQAVIYSGFHDPQQGRTLLRKCGAEAMRLLNHVSALEACDAGAKLTSNGASLLDIAEFMYVCTAGWGASSTHLLKMAGFNRSKLGQMARQARELARDFKRLNHLGLPGPLTVFKNEADPKKSEAYVVLFESLPAMLNTSAEIVGNWPFPGSHHDFPHRQFGKHYLLAYFHAYVHWFSGSYSDLSALMRLMLEVRFAVSPGASVLMKTKGGRQKAAREFPFTQFAQQKGSHRKNSAGDERDPLSAKALQMAIERFRKRYPNVSNPIPTHIEKYHTDKRIRPQRNKGMTFLKAFDKL